jgi:hypothetical protein
MNDTLSQALAELNVQQGEIRCFEVEGIFYEIRRVADDEPFEDQMMLEPWVEFPKSDAAVTIHVRPGKLPLPDPPYIPPDDKGRNDVQRESKPGMGK